MHIYIQIQIFGTRHSNGRPVDMSAQALLWAIIGKSKKFIFCVVVGSKVDSCCLRPLHIRAWVVVGGRCLCQRADLAKLGVSV